MRPVVGIVNRDHVSVGKLQTVVARGICPLVYLVSQNSNAGVTRSESIRNLQRFVARTVIDDDDLKIAPSLV